MNRKPSGGMVVAGALVILAVSVLWRQWDTDARPSAYQFVVRPGDDPASLRLEFPGSRMVEVDRAGELIVQNGDTATHAGRPRAYQHIGGSRRDVEVRFVLDAKGDVRFVVGAYDRRQALVITAQP